MDTAAANPQPPPTDEEIEDLKRLAAGIVRAQGNRFIKELLRKKGIRIGTKKDDFEQNLTDAIESGHLKLEDVDEWLRTIEGWGDQHVYLYNLSPALTKELTPTRIRQRVKLEGYDPVWEGNTVLEFPDEPQLTSISFTNSVLRLIWQEASPGWTPVPDKNFQKEEGLDLYEFRAWRKVEQRAITRFEAHLDKGIAGLFVANPIQGQEHEKAIEEAWSVLGKLITLQELENNQVDISVVSKNLDQRNRPKNNKPPPDIKAQKSRLGSGGSYVEFAANSKDKAYWEETAIRNVRNSVKEQQLDSFQGSGGIFSFLPGTGHADLQRPLRVQLYSKGDRVRLWAQMDAEEVWTILTKLAAYQ